MFGKKKSKTAYKQSISKSNSKKAKATPSIIGIGGSIEGGTLKSSGDVYIDGYYVGNIAIEGDIIIGATGAVYGDVMATNAIISGNCKGNIKVIRKVHLMSSAVVEGTIDCMETVIDEKAVFNGQFKMFTDVQLPVAELIPIPSHGLE